VALRIATRGSALALTQSGMVAEMLGGAELVEVSSDGDPGDKSRFVRAVETALLEGRAEVGVHSAKDLPGEEVEGLEIAAVPPREDPADAWIGMGSSLEDAPEGARVGTVSLRRRAQLLAVRPDLRVLDLNGNVDTRLRKLADGGYDAIILAAAGLRRLGRAEEIGFRVPADAASLAELRAERACFTRLEADCSTPIGVHATLSGETLRIGAFVGLPDGSEWVRDELDADPSDPHAAGVELAKRLLGAGAGELLARAAAEAG